MKTCLLALSLLVGLSAQTVTLSGPTIAVPGQSVPVALNVTGTTGANMNGIGWTATANGNPVLGWVAGPDAISSTKTIWCGPSVCFLVGVTAAGAVSNIPLTDEVLATTSFPVPAAQALGPLVMALGGLTGSNGGGTALPISAGPAYTITIQAPNACDVNGDGVVTGADALAVLKATPGVSTVAPLPACPTSFGCTLQTVESIIHAVPSSLGGDGAACSLGH